MAVFGFGANFDGTDMAGEFIKNNEIYIGWGKDDAPSQYNLLRSIKAGDIVYIKSQAPSVGLHIKGIGIVLSHDVNGKSSLNMKWISDKVIKWGKVNDKYNVRSNTLYEEFNPEIIETILNELFSKLEK